MNIAYFPQIYEDELVYSVLARYYIHSGYLHSTDAVQDIFLKRSKGDMEFVKHLKPEIVNLLTRHMTLEELIEKHTMYPFYGRFIDGNRRNAAFKALMSMDGDFSKLFSVPNLRKGEHRYMRYCPMCVLNDREKHGETYWHRLHQMRYSDLCPVHGCRLMDSSVSLDSKEWFFLASAEEAMPSGKEVLQRKADDKGSPIEIKLSQYMAEVFQQPVDRNSMTLVKDFLHSKIAGTPYLSSRGEKCYYHRLWEDMKNFYQGISVMDSITDGQIQRLLTGDRFSFTEICMTAMFLHISAEELAEMKEPAKTPQQQFDDRVMELMESGIGLSETAGKMGVSVSIVEVSLRKMKQENSAVNRNRKNNCIRKDWEELDRQTLPLVKKAVRELHGGGTERPHRISFCAVSKKLDIPNHRLYKMEQCKKEIEQHIESSEQFWARKVIWAVNALQAGKRGSGSKPSKSESYG